MTIPTVEQQLRTVRQGVELIVPDDELTSKLEQSYTSQTPLRIKYGIDPTGIDLHLGHTVPLRKLRQFQDLGHQAVIIVGDYTARIGDPSGRDDTRTGLTPEQVDQNAHDYLSQLAKIIDLDKAEVVRNGDWFGQMTFADAMKLCSHITLSQLMSRSDFAQRLEDNRPVFLHECLYTIMQAYDSVQVRADIEVGGIEQLHTFMLARDLQRAHNQAPQVGVLCPILVGLDGALRMGKSLGNYIGVADQPFTMMKKFMQLPDRCMPMYFALLTDLDAHEVESLLAGHPRDAKLTLAKTIIAQYHGAPQAAESADQWEREIAQGGLPADIPTVSLSMSELNESKLPAAILLKRLGLCASSSEARRIIAQRGAYVGADKRAIECHDELIYVSDGLLVWVGTKRFCRVVLIP